MAREHGERLSSADAALLHMETRTQHMHAGGLFVFEPPDSQHFDFQRFVRLVRARIHLVPRYRQRLASTPLHLANPVWVDDRDFDIAYHVRHAALPPPGDTPQLMDYVARVLSRQLDRDRPLWELYVIQGLKDGRVALLSKNHHAMVDDGAGLDLASVMLDFAPDEGGEPPTAQEWTPQPLPSEYELAGSAIRGLVSSPGDVLDAARRVASGPGNAVRTALRVGRGVASVARANLARPAPRSVLNRPPGPHRRFAVQRIALEDVKTVKDALDTTVNDVVLAMVADATGQLLRDVGAHTDGLWLRAMVPISVRADSDEHTLGSHVASVFVNLPMFEMDPVERLRICHDAMVDVKSSHRAVGADFLTGLSQFAPPTLHAMASRVAARGRLYNFLITNVPGPQVPVYCMGYRLVGAFPFAPLTASQSYAVGVTSIDGSMNFGFTADRDALPDLDRVGEHLLGALDDLLASAGAVDTRRALTEPRTDRPGGDDRATEPAGTGT